MLLLNYPPHHHCNYILCHSLAYYTPIRINNKTSDYNNYIIFKKCNNYFTYAYTTISMAHIYNCIIIFLPKEYSLIEKQYLMSTILLFIKKMW